MNEEEFRKKVAEMQEWQTKYFRTRDRIALSRSKEIEKIVRDDNQRYFEIHMPPKPEQTSLF